MPNTRPSAAMKLRGYVAPNELVLAREQAEGAVRTADLGKIVAAAAALDVDLAVQQRRGAAVPALAVHVVARVSVFAA
jgi:hypothetical protein